MMKETVKIVKEEGTVVEHQRKYSMYECRILMLMYGC